MCKNTQTLNPILTPEAVVILAGGSGRRMGSLTKSQTKCLIPIVEQTTLLDWHLRLWQRIGAKKIIVVARHRAKEVQMYIGARACPIEITVNEVVSQGTAGALYETRRFLSGDFWYSHADILFHHELIHSIMMAYSRSDAQDTVIAVCDATIASTHARAVMGSQGYLSQLITSRNEECSLSSSYISLGVGIIRSHALNRMWGLHPCAMIEDGLDWWRKQDAGQISCVCSDTDVCHVVSETDIHLARSFLNKSYRHLC